MNIKSENQLSFKESFDDENELVKYGQSIINFNKNYSEISILKETNLNSQDKNILLFLLFDGHNGPEVSKYLSVHFSQFLTENINFINTNYEKALEETFINIDDSLRSSEAQLELSKYSIKKDEKNNFNKNEIFYDFLELFEPRNLEGVNIAEFCGSSGIVILITDKKVFVANIGNSKCVPINNKNEIMKEKINREHMVNDEYEIKRLKDKFGYSINDILNANTNDKMKDKIKDNFINNLPLATTRGFGDLQYKESKIMNFGCQYISNKPDIIEISIEELKYLIIGNYGCFNDNDNDISLEKYFLDKYNKNKEQKLSQIIEDFFEEKNSMKKGNNIIDNNINNLASFIIEFKNDNHINIANNNNFFDEPKEDIQDKEESTNKKNQSEDEEDNL